MKKFLLAFLLVLPHLVFPLSGGGGYFMFGHNVLNIANLNTELKNSGYSTLSDNFVSYGGGGYAIVNNFVIGGEGHGLVGRDEDVSKDYKATLSAGYGFFNIGYVIFELPKFHIYPLLGIGGGGMTVKILERSSPSFKEVLENPKRGVEISTGGLLVSLSLCLEHLLSIGNEYGGAEGGILLGLRLGYTWSPNYNWTFDGTNLSGAPEVGINGYFIRLCIGFGGFSY